MTQVELAERLGVSASYVSQVMNGKKKPSKRMLGEMVNLCQPKVESEKAILSLARLPVPTLPRDARLASMRISTSHRNKLTRVNQILTRKFTGSFLASGRQNLPVKTLTFYHTCLSKAIVAEFTKQQFAFGDFLRSANSG